MRKFLERLGLLAAKGTQLAPKPDADEDAIWGSSDPLDPGQRWQATENPGPKFRSISEFPLFERDTVSDKVGVKRKVLATAMDAIHRVNIGDDDSGAPVAAGLGNNGSPYTVPVALANWYMSQSFIGYQFCAILAQHWLVDKACTMAGEDAARNGWKIAAKNEADLDQKNNDRLRALDIEYKVKENLVEFNRFKNVFGIRVMLFEVETDDEDAYYAAPFNPDGVEPGSYKGMSQVDPYWMMPMMTAESTADPSSRHFYEPEYWIISGRRYHRSHLVIRRGPEPADILKPTYLFGGIPLTQRIYERVYAAERTANEAPLLSLNKRTTAIHVDMDKAILNQGKLEERLAVWIRYRDNHGVKVLGKEEVMEQFDTNLSDFDSIIMNQYQIVSAIAEVPSTKLLGTSPKGFNATGEFEMKSYHEKLETIQEHDMTPVLDRHYMLLCKSEEINAEINVIWEPVDTPTAAEQADLNAKQAETDERNVNIGAISPDEVRDRLRDDDRSGYNRLSDEDANAEPGMSPENIAAYEKSTAEGQKGAAATQTATARQTAANASAEKVGAPEATGGVAPKANAATESEEAERAGEAPRAPAVAGAASGLHAITGREPGITSPKEGETERDVIALLGELSDRLTAIQEWAMPEGGNVDDHEASASRSVSPHVKRSVRGRVGGINAVVGSQDPHKLPKIKMHGLVCAIENPRDSIRKGQNLDGKTWQAKMKAHYGFIKGHIGADGDEIDCFVGPNPKAQRVYVINQKDPNTDEFDEHKCMMGFDSPEQAKKMYDDSFSKGWTGYCCMHDMSVDEFKHWLANGDLTSEAGEDAGSPSPLAESEIGSTQSNSNLADS